jgi:hypothetical protein
MVQVQSLKIRMPLKLQVYSKIVICLRSFKCLFCTQFSSLSLLSLSGQGMRESKTILTFTTLGLVEEVPVVTEVSFVYSFFFIVSGLDNSKTLFMHFCVGKCVWVYDLCFIVGSYCCRSETNIFRRGPQCFFQ